MAWDVEYTQEFYAWWESLTADEQEAIRTSVALLRKDGPNLGRPHVDTVKGSKYTQMKELRTQFRGHPLRTFFAFDPRRSAILLIGGDKTGKKRFYEEMLPLADKLYEVYLQELADEGLI